MWDCCVLVARPKGVNPLSTGGMMTPQIQNTVPRVCAAFCWTGRSFERHPCPQANPLPQPRSFSQPFPGPLLPNGLGIKTGHRCPSPYLTSGFKDSLVEIPVLEVGTNVTFQRCRPNRLSIGKVNNMEVQSVFDLGCIQVISVRCGRPDWPIGAVT